MKIIFAVLIGLLLVLQYQLWFDQGSVSDVKRLNKLIAKQQQQNQQLAKRNAALLAEVNSLKHGRQAIEAHARHDLGMIKKNETYYRIIKR